MSCPSEPFLEVTFFPANFLFFGISTWKIMWDDDDVDELTWSDFLENYQMLDYLLGPGNEILKFKIFRRNRDET